MALRNGSCSFSICSLLFFSFCARRKISKEKWTNHPENAVLYFLIICFSERQLIKPQSREVWWIFPGYKWKLCGILTFHLVFQTLVMEHCFPGEEMECAFFLYVYLCWWLWQLLSSWDVHWWDHTSPLPCSRRKNLNQTMRSLKPHVLHEEGQGPEVGMDWPNRGQLALVRWGKSLVHLQKELKRGTRRGR